ncbi:MAG: SDR family NAD(P)-dependent oxidoreductase, partial [Sphingobacterium sp.]
MAKIILVTGATSGFGRAIAIKFAGHGWDCIITGRRAGKLTELAAQLEEHHKVRVLPLNFDVRDKKEVFRQLGDLPPDWRSIQLLVNNAGLALGRETFDEAFIEDWETMIDTNLKGLLYVSKAIIPYFIQQGRGHIINLGSTAAK